MVSLPLLYPVSESQETSLSQCLERVRAVMAEINAMIATPVLPANSTTEPLISAWHQLATVKNVIEALQGMGPEYMSAPQETMNSHQERQPSVD